MTKTPSTTYDFIIAGGGSAGATLAARLSEDPSISVCLVEAGSRGRSPFITMPAGNGFIFGNPKFDWGFHSVPQPGLDGRRIYYPRGKGLGGSSIMNGLIYIRGNAHDYDRWRQSGLPGWSYAEVLPYFKRAEGAIHRDPRYHGHQGPIKVSPAANYDQVSQAFVEAAKQAGAPLNSDFNGASQVGVGRLDSTVFRGRRQSTGATYLAQIPGNLSVLTNTRAIRLSIRNARVQGLEISDGNGTTTIYANREVISCLGAFGTPQLLMLSGIGPAEHLKQMDITPILDRPGVGDALYDHPNMPMCFELPDASLSLARFQRIDRAFLAGLQYLLTHKGPGSGSFWSTALFHPLHDPTTPGFEIFCTPMMVKEEAGRAGWTIQKLLRLGSSVFARGKSAMPGVQFDINLLQPKSFGRLRLASKDPAAPPLIDPAYFQQPSDLNDLIEGLKHMREVARQPAFLGLLGKEIIPGPTLKSDSQIATALRAHTTTGHHPVSSCRMGRENDPGAVLDVFFRVLGIEGLRVVDASAFPSQLTGNTNAAVIMMAERATDMLLGRTQLPPETPQ